MAERFEEVGYLSNESKRRIEQIRAESADWFALAEDLNTALMRSVAAAKERAQTGSMQPAAIAVRIGLRACGTLQGVLLLIERGMVAEGRMLARSLIEDAFCIAALHAHPEAFIQLLKADSQASRRNQVKFIQAEQLLEQGDVGKKLQGVVDQIGKKDQIMNVKELAKMGAFLKQYLYYQRLSDDAAHTSARALNRHIATDPERRAWRYRFEPGNLGENNATIHSALLAAFGIGVGLTNIVNDAENNARFERLVVRFEAMPEVPAV